ncbi:MAG TPA: flagellar hook-length control protein FliK [Caproicibacter sp.]|nr:flagellar hook-length control protein FliK [Caproicibacter sp.]
MVQQISSNQMVQNAAQSGQSSNASKSQKADSFQSMLQSVTQQNQTNDNGKTDTAGGKTKGDAGKAKDEKDPAKDAASLVQPDAASAYYTPVIQNSAAQNASLANEILPAVTDVSAQTSPVQQNITPQQILQAVQAAQAQQAVPVQQPAQTALAQTAQAQTAAVKSVMPEKVQAQPNAVNEVPVQTKSADGTDLNKQNAAQLQTAMQLNPSSEKTQNAAQQQTVQSIQTSSNTAETAKGSAVQTEESLKVSDAQDKKSEQTSDNSGAGAKQLTDLYSNGKVVVKVSDVSKQVKTPVTHQVANAVTEGLKNGKQELKIDLYPQSLGKVSVKLSTENGILTVEIAAANPRTQSLLASSSDEIKTILQSTTGQNIQITKPQQNSQYYGQDGNSAQQNAQQQQQQQQQAEKQKNLAEWYQIGNTANISTDDFLSLLRQTGASA